jgi:hypothetical protein
MYNLTPEHFGIGKKTNSSRSWSCIATAHDVFNFHWVIEVDYDEDRDCDARGCSGVCRCSQITNERVTAANINNICSHVVSKTIHACSESLRPAGKRGSVKQVKLTPIEEYGIRRICINAGMWEKDNYEITKRGGYYGEEVDGVYFCDIDQVVKDLIEFFSLKTINEQVEYLLNQEYATILPTLKGKNYSVNKINLKDIKPGNDIYALKKKSLEYLTEEGFDLTKEIACVVVEDNGKYRIIDGYHRYAYAINSNARKVKVILAV